MHNCQVNGSLAAFVWLYTPGEWIERLTVHRPSSLQTTSQEEVCIVQHPFSPIRSIRSSSVPLAQPYPHTPGADVEVNPGKHK